MGRTFVLVSSPESDQLHIITFDDWESDRWHWDVANCGESMGEWAPVRFEKDAGVPLTMACARCFEYLADGAQREQR